MANVNARDIRLRRLTDETCMRLRRRQLVGSRNVAREVLALFVAAIEHLADEQRWTTFEHFMSQISKLGLQLEQAGPKELVIGNIVKRVINLLHGEYNGALAQTLEDAASSAGESLPPTPSSFAQTPAGMNLRMSENATDFFAHAADITRRQPSGASMDDRSPRSGSSTPLSLSRAPSMFDLLGHKTALSRLQPASTSSSQSATPIDQTTPTISPIISRAPSLNFARTFGLARLDTPASTEADISAEENFSKNAYTQKRAFTDALVEILEEVESAHEEIAQQALDHISAQEMVLTVGHSKTVEEFLKAAALKRKFTVVVAETAPTYRGRKMAKALSAAKIETILIPDACIFAFMSRVTKMIVGAHAVLADGSFFGISGTLPACRAAKVHLKPVIVCTGLYKLCPVFLGNDFSQLDEGSPLEILEDSDSAGTDGPTQTCNPYYDKIPPDLVNLFITNDGGNPSSMCYRLLTDLYGAA